MVRTEWYVLLTSILGKNYQSSWDSLKQGVDDTENNIARQSLNVLYVTTDRGLLVKAGSDMEIWQGSNS